jgi:FG-GAP-like repeat
MSVLGDYNGDGETDFAIWRRSEGGWYVNDGVTPFTTWGQSGDIPVPGDYNGEGKTDIAIYRPAKAAGTCSGNRRTPPQLGPRLGAHALRSASVHPS